MLIRRVTILFIFFGIVLTVLQYRLWFESGGILDMIALKKQVASIASENEKLKRRNDDLLLEVQQVQKNKDAVESRARSELGMIKKGETFYQVVEK